MHSAVVTSPSVPPNCYLQAECRFKNPVILVWFHNFNHKKLNYIPLKNINIRKMARWECQAYRGLKIRKSNMNHVEEEQFHMTQNTTGTSSSVPKTKNPALKFALLLDHLFEQHHTHTRVNLRGLLVARCLTVSRTEGKCSGRHFTACKP